MSGRTWTLDLESEHRFLLPFLVTEPDGTVKVRVVEHVGAIVQHPVRPRLEEPEGVYSMTVPDTDVALIWTLDWEQHVVVLVTPPTHLGHRQET